MKGRPTLWYPFLFAALPVLKVNVFQKVLSHYFGAQVQPATDQLYLSLERTPYRLRSVDPATLGP